MSSEIDENITNVDDQWNDIPENVYFYESIDDNGRVLGTVPKLNPIFETCLTLISLLNIV